MRIGFIACFAIAYIAWIFFNMNAGQNTLILGVPVALIAASVSSRFLLRDLQPKHLSPLRLVSFAIYAADFAIALVKANIFMMGIIMNPNSELKPAVLRLPLRTNSEFVTAGVSNSITLTPGTLTIDAEDGFLYVHWIVASELESVKAKEGIVGNFESNLKGVFEA
ncbi:MAG: Na+/H+ antiporter subunit E [Candidatus Micrarchaeota archaeon]